MILKGISGGNFFNFAGLYYILVCTPFKNNLISYNRTLYFGCHEVVDYFKKENKRQKFVAIESYDNPKDATSLSNLYLEDLKSIFFCSISYTFCSFC